VEGTFPSSAGADIVEVGGAVCVGLRPFAAEGGTETVGSLVVNFDQRARSVQRMYGLTQSSCLDFVSSGQSTLCKHN